MRRHAVDIDALARAVRRSTSARQPTMTIAGFSFEQRDLVRQLVGRPGIVGIEEGEVFAFGDCDGAIARCGGAAIHFAGDDGEIVSG